MSDPPTMMAAPAWAVPKRADARARAAFRAPTLMALYLGAPLAVLIAGGGPAATAIAAHLTTWTAVILLSRARGFFWRDLWPRDGLSEWRSLAALALCLVLVAWGRDAGGWAALIPLAVAIELTHRILPLRDLPRFAGGDRGREALGALATALFYAAAAGGGWRAALFGLAVGWLCGRLLTRTGHFPLICLTHAVAAVAMATVGPGFR